MTGEVTLRGAVMPIGGVKEKIVAAHRAGIRTVILPEWNQKDVFHEVPEEVRDEMTFRFCSRMEEVLELALGMKGLAERVRQAELNPPSPTPAPAPTVEDTPSAV
jgi:ATP-dependent Lon protease